MFRFALRNQAVMLVLLAGLGAVSAAQAQVPHKEASSGQIFNVTATQFEFASEGHGTHFGKYSEHGVTRYYDDGTCEGEFHVTAADGSKLGGIFYGTFFDLGGGFTGFDVTVEWLEGTGRLAGTTGIGSATATVENATGKAEISARGTWNKP